MYRTLSALALALGVLACLVLSHTRPATPPAPPTATGQAAGMTGFLPNLGQWNHPARFVAAFGPMTAFVEPEGWTMTLRRPVASTTGSHRRDRIRELHRRRRSGQPVQGKALALRTRFVGATAGGPIAGGAPLAGVHNFHLGRDPSRWRTGVRAYGRVAWEGLYPGVDVQLRRTDNRLEYDLLLAPGAALEPVRLRLEGNRDLRLADDGGLIIETELGPVRQSAPVTWQVDRSGRRQPLECRYRILGPHTYGFVLPRRNPALAVVIDPVLDFGTFLGTTSGEYSWAIKVDPAGNTTAISEADLASFPTTTGAYDTTFNGSSDVAITRFNPAGTALVYSTFLGGSGYEAPYDLVLDRNGDALLVGETDSANFPVTAGAFQTALKGTADGFVTRLAANGGALVYSTYLGGTGDDYAYGVGLDPAGQATVAGDTDSTDFPVTPGAYDTTYNGNIDGFVFRLDKAGAKAVWGTYVGSSAGETPWALAVDVRGRAFISGDTTSTTYPVTVGAFDTTANGLSDLFVTCLENTGASLVYSTYLGGTGNDYGWKVAVDLAGRAFACGESASGDYPTTPGSWDVTLGGTRDGVVTALAPDGKSLVWSTYLGGSGTEYINAVDIDLAGNPVVAGDTTSLDFPTTPGAWSRTSAGKTDAFGVRFDRAGNRLLYATYLGGSEYDGAWGVTVTTLGDRLYLFGDTDSINFPVTAGAWDTTHNGNTDLFAAGLTVRPAGLTRFGTPTPACSGPITPYPLEAPTAGQSKFGLACTGAPPSTSGLLLIAPGRLSAALPILGFGLWLDPTGLLLVFPATSDAGGEGSVPLPIPTGTVGARLFTQFLWLNTAGCGGAGTLSASDGLEITVQ